MTEAEFLASLPDAITLRGPGSGSVTTVPAAIRRDIGLAIRAGVLPSGIKVSVRREDYKSIHVAITAWEGAVLCDEYIETIMDPTVKWNRWESRRTSPDAWRHRYRAELSDALNAALVLLERLAERHNYNDSDSMRDHFDVGYYLHVTADVEHDAVMAVRTEADPAMAELLRRATSAAGQLGMAVVRSVCGKGGVSGSGEWAWKKLVSLADAAKGRPLAYDKRRRRWVLADAVM